MGKGSIPAHAGEPYTAWSAPYMLRVYPRPRGGTGLANHTAVDGVGLSPPTRGNPRPQLGRRLGQRSIPAHAGEPGMQALWHDEWRVYPRPRGGT